MTAVIHVHRGMLHDRTADLHHYLITLCMERYLGLNSRITYGCLVFKTA